MEEIPVIRVAILGAESSGKSTLAEALARQYGASWVPEYLREFVDTAGRVPFEHDQALIAKTQREREDEALASAQRFLFCDTTPLMTALYSHEYWGRVDPATAALAAEHNYDHTFVTAPDSPWEADGLQRESDEVRQRIHRCVLDELTRRHIPYVLLSGALEDRLRLAESILGTPSLG
jgi:NadR type nicotinamide-nucleotide adenylyltransferase